MGTFAISENSDEMLQNAAFHRDALFAKTKTNRTEIHYSLIRVHIVYKLKGLNLLCNAKNCH